MSALLFETIVVDNINYVYVQSIDYRTPSSSGHDLAQLIPAERKDRTVERKATPVDIPLHLFEIIYIFLVKYRFARIKG
jgi:hypothetical protein